MIRTSRYTHLLTMVKRFINGWELTILNDTNKDYLRLEVEAICAKID